MDHSSVEAPDRGMHVQYDHESQSVLKEYCVDTRLARLVFHAGLVPMLCLVSPILRLAPVKAPVWAEFTVCPQKCLNADLLASQSHGW